MSPGSVVTGNLEQLPALELPPERPHRAQRVLPGAEQGAALLFLLVRELAGREEVGAGQRVQQVREHGGVVVVAAAAQRLERVLRQAEARPAKAARAHAGRGFDRVLGLAQLLVELGGRVEMQPGLVAEAVIADLVAGGGDGAQRRAVLLERGVLADDEEGDREPPFGEEGEDSRHDGVEIGRMRLPAGVAVRLHVGPLVVEVQREARVARHASLTGSPFILSERCAASSTLTTRRPSCPSLTGCLRERTQSMKWRHSICSGSPTLM